MFLNKKEAIFFVVLGLIFFKLTIKEHAIKKPFNYHSEIWADKASYYVYLPATFYYNFNPKEFPYAIDSLTGQGFKYENNKIKTKVTYGVALLQSPFFIAAHSLSGFMNNKTDGFSIIYHRSIDIAAIFYFILGLIFIYKFLLFYFQKIIALTSTLIVAVGTNLYYYAIDEPGMSHIYSFALAALFFYLIKRSNFLKNGSLLKTIGISLVFSVLVLIRPTNILFGLFYFIFDIQTLEDISVRFKRLLKRDIIIPFSIIVFIVFLPQFMYWKYLSGSYLTYSYGEESFNFLDPEFIKYLFSARSGFFPYAPIMTLVIIAPFLSSRFRRNTIYTASIFLIVLYIFSSWYDWTYGCSFGARGMVEYAPYFSFSLAVCIHYLSKNGFLIKVLGGVIILLFIGINLSLSNSFDKCFFGQGDWDWKEYKSLLKNEQNG